MVMQPIRMLPAATSCPGHGGRIRCGVNPAIQSNAGKPPLYGAAVRGRAAAFKLLLAAGADPNGNIIGGDTVLHWAAEHGHGVVLKVLLAAGADIYSNNKQGYTPLRLSLQCPQIRRLLKDAARQRKLQDSGLAAPALG